MNNNIEEEKYHEEEPVEKPSIERIIENDRRRVVKTFLTLGPTRMGKSSFINALAGKPICVVG